MLKRPGLGADIRSVEPGLRRVTSRARTRAFGRARAEEGFTLLETIVAMSIVVSVLVATAGVLVNMLGGALLARQNQQSAEVLSEEIERVRAAGYSAVAMVAEDLAGDDAVTGPDASGDHWFDPDGAGPLTTEKVAVSRGGVVDPHLRTITRNATAYTLRTYVTEPVDAEGGRYRRVTVQTEWTRGAKTHTRQASTLVTLTRRGLPLPNFTFGEPVTVSVNGGTSAVLPATLVNRGARDSWNLSVTTAPTKPWTFTWYRDENKNGVRNAEDIVALTDSDGDGLPDTDELDTDEDVWLFAVTTVPATTVAGDVSVTLRAVSAGQPSSSTGTATIVDTVQVVSQSCSGCTYRSYYLRNAQNNAIDTQARSDMPMQLVAPAETSLPNYDTNRDAAPGRWLSLGGAGAVETSTALMANWQYSVPADMQFGDAAHLNVPLRLKSAVLGVANVTVYVRAELTKNVFTTVGTASFDVVAGTYLSHTVDVPLTPFDLARNRRFEVKVVSSLGDVELAYGVAGYAAQVDMPVVSG